MAFADRTNAVACGTADHSRHVVHATGHSSSARRRTRRLRVECDTRKIPDGREKSAPAHARSLRLMRATVRAVSPVLAPGVLEQIDGRGGAAADWVTRSPRVRESLRLEA